MSETLKPLSTLPGRPSSNRGTFFTFLFGGLLLWMTAWYGISSYLVEPLADPNNTDKARLLPSIFGFGFNQLRFIPAWVFAAWLVITFIAMWVVARRRSRVKEILGYGADFLYQRRVFLLIFCAACSAVFFLFRSQLISDDTLHFMNWMPHQAAHGITHVRFDEMLESNLHFEAYKLVNSLWGWDVQFTYNVVSSLAGGVFVYFLLLLTRRLAGAKSLALFAFLVSGGYMQLFFGDKENYTLAVTLVLIYFYFSHRYLVKEAAITTPAFFLALAMAFHLEAAFLLPSLFYLTVVELNRRKYFSAAAAWILLASLFSLVVLYFLHRGASWEILRDTSWGLGRGGNVLFNIVFPSGLTVYSRLNMLFLIFPSVIFLLPLILAGGLKTDHLTGHLLTAAIPGLFFSWVWISTIGFYSDWNLFSMPMLPVVLLIGVCLLRGRIFSLKYEIMTGATMISLLATYTWIIHNHYLFPR